MNLKISTKLMIFYFVLLIFSVLLSSALYRNIYSTILSKKVSEVSLQTLYSINSNINSIIQNADNLSKVLISSQEIQKPLASAESLNNNISTSFLEQGQGSGEIRTIKLDEQRKVNAYVSNYVESFPFISSVYIFDEYGQRYGVDNMPLKKLVNSNFRETSSYIEAKNQKGAPILTLNAGSLLEIGSGEKYISLIRVINNIDIQNLIGLLILNIAENEMVNSFRDIINKYDTDIMIINENGEKIIDFKNHKGIDFDSIINLSVDKEFGSYIKKVNGESYLISHLNNKEYNWKIISIIPFSELSKESSIFGVIAFIVIILNSLLLISGSVFISRLITVPIKNLLTSMKGVEKGDFKIVEMNVGNDEIGKLKDGYNMMILEIENLIDRVVYEHKLKRKIELDILQSQIKPHFLYNTFDSIKALALIGRNEDVYTMLKALGSFYRTSLSKGSEVISIGEEIEVVKNYITIQKMRFGNIVNVDYEVDEEIRSYKILKLVLQPLVENALSHGIQSKGEEGNIIIKAKKHEKYVILTVEDNGIGMEADQVQVVLDRNYESSNLGFGLKGTIERLRIFYGKDDLCTIQSQKDIGTKIIISIPIKLGGINE